MIKKICLLLLTLSLSFSFSSSAWAQQQPGALGTKKTGPRKHAATIIFAGLGGAVLGLSTLSFYGRPQDRLANIAIGAAIGVITGTVYTLYKAATEPADFYGTGAASMMLEPSNHHQMAHRGFEPKLTYKFEF